MNTWGHNIRLSIFGESHGNALGIAIDGLPHGFALDMAHTAAELERRAPGRSELSTPRRESDTPEVLSGLLNGVTTGAPLCAIFRNGDTRSRDYHPETPRPGHADYPAFVRFGGHADHRGGGHFSGRLTAPLVFAGAIAKQLLAQKNIEVNARIVSIYSRTEDEGMRAAILEAKADGDSVGGVIECVATGVPAGIGNPFFGSVESVVSSMMYSIPAVKGVEFGDGFALADMRGFAANDGLRYDDGGAVKLTSNHSGGINGGITNGNPVVVKVAIRPTPTVSTVQPTINLESGQNVEVSFGGRHDPCIVPRAVPVVEAALALCLLDLMG